MSEYIRHLKSLVRALSIAVVALTVLMTAGYWYAMTNPFWACMAEDEIVVINNTCVHMDEL